MELIYIIGYFVFIAIIIGVIIWLVRDTIKEKEMQKKLKDK